MNKKLSIMMMSLSALVLSLFVAPAAEAGQHCRTNSRVVVRGPSIHVTAPRVVVRTPAPRYVARPVVYRAPYRSYAQVYVVHRGVPHQVWVDGYYDHYGRWISGYWTWTY